MTPPYALAGFAVWLLLLLCLVGDVAAVVTLRADLSASLRNASAAYGGF